MTGNEILYFIQSLLADLLDIANADLLSVAWRLLLLVLGIGVVVGFFKLIYHILEGLFGGLLAFLWRMVFAPFRFPARWRERRRIRKARREHTTRMLQGDLEQRKRQEEAEKRRQEQEREAFEKIMNQAPDLSKFKK